MPDLDDVVRKADEIQREMERPLRECQAELARVEEQRDYFLRESEANGEAADNLRVWLEKARSKLTQVEKENDALRSELDGGKPSATAYHRDRAEAAEARSQDLASLLAEKEGALKRLIEAAEAIEARVGIPSLAPEWPLLYNAAREARSMLLNSTPTEEAENG